MAATAEADHEFGLHGNSPAPLLTHMHGDPAIPENGRLECHKMPQLAKCRPTRWLQSALPSEPRPSLSCKVFRSGPSAPSPGMICQR
jgi:hypothetical protein